MSDTSDATKKISLSSITRGASLFLFGRLLSRFLRFIFNLILTRRLGAAQYGIYAYAWTIIVLTSSFAQFGSGKALLRFIPAYEDDPLRRNQYVGLAYLTALVASSLIGFILFVSAPTISSFTFDTDVTILVIRVMSIVLPFNTIISVTSDAFRGVERMGLQVFVKDVASPIIQLSVVGIAILLGYSLLGIVAAIAIGTILVSIISVMVIFSQTVLQPTLGISHPSLKYNEYYRYSVPLALKEVGSVLYSRVDILMVGFFLAESSVGIYKISVLVGTIISLPLGSFSQLFSPVISRLYTDDNIDDIEYIYETITRWTFTISIPIVLTVGIYSDELLAVFGPEFSAGTLVLGLFAIGHLTNSLVGPSGNLLMMTDHQYLNMINQWILGGLNIILNYFFILRFGLIGAALATASVLAFINIVRVAEVRYTEGIHPYSVLFWKPIAAGVLVGTLMIILSNAFDGYTLLIGGSITGVATYVILLFAFGFEERDRELFYDTIQDSF